MTITQVQELLATKGDAMSVAQEMMEEAGLRSNLHCEHPTWAILQNSIANLALMVWELRAEASRGKTP
jgi:hypothetical protein